MSAITVNPAWENAPFEESIVKPDGSPLIPGEVYRRFASIEDAEKGIAIPHYCFDGVPTHYPPEPLKTEAHRKVAEAMRAARIHACQKMTRDQFRKQSN